MNTVTVSPCARKRSTTISATCSKYDGKDAHPASPWIFMYDHRLSRSSEMLASGFFPARSVRPLPHATTHPLPSLFDSRGVRAPAVQRTQRNGSRHQRCPAGGPTGQREPPKESEMTAD